MPSTWGKTAKIVRTADAKDGEVHPQKVAELYNSDAPTVEKVRFSHSLPIVSPLFFPQSITHFLSPLRSLFSPISTQPITITTNFKKEER